MMMAPLSRTWNTQRASVPSTLATSFTTSVSHVSPRPTDWGNVVVGTGWLRPQPEGPPSAKPCRPSTCPVRRKPRRGNFGFEPRHSTFSSSVSTDNKSSIRCSVGKSGSAYACALGATADSGAVLEHVGAAATAWGLLAGEPSRQEEAIAARPNVERAKVSAGRVNMRRSIGEGRAEPDGRLPSNALARGGEMSMTSSSSSDDHE